MQVVRTVQLAPLAIEESKRDQFKALAKANNRTVAGQLRHLIDRALVEANTKDAA